MAKKRKSDASRLDEVDRTMYSTFCSAANSLSQIYTQAMSQQKLAFQAGERHGLVRIFILFFTSLFSPIRSSSVVNLIDWSFGLFASNIARI
ncbi:hypothetical protein M5K25_004699 [Dendrobium thyrsiflorum]|uniref:Uncharacterized protein n=1 Tax=Dendrobium thyrsiflorum TaxID=117978 RepID=A0ABD0VFI6_DENTH